MTAPRARVCLGTALLGVLILAASCSQLSHVEQKAKSTASSLEQKAAQSASSIESQVRGASPFGGTSSSVVPTSGGIVRTGVGWSAAGLEGTIPATGSCHAGSRNGFTTPDPLCTPGAIDTAVSQGTLSSTICRPGGYTSSVRAPESLTEPAKRRLMAAYGDSGSMSTYELDHLVPLELGGSNALANLWPEPNQGSPSEFDPQDPYGINAKDGVEGRLHDAVCSGDVPLTAAQQAIATNWTTAEQVLGVAP